MKRAILIGFVAMAPVAGCGSDGDTSVRGRGPTQADQVGGQAPPSDPNNPLPDPQAPKTDPNAPVSAASNPIDGQGTAAPRLNCVSLCGSSTAQCQNICTQVCTGIGAITTCAPQVNAFLACAGGVRFACNGRGSISIVPVNSCNDEGQAALQCLGIDISIRVSDSTDNAGNPPSGEPPPGR